MATVAGFATADIHSAATQAGVGGTVFFPNGTYNVDGLTVSFASQTWNLDRLAILKRTAGTTGPVVNVQADAWRLRGGTLDGNRANNPNSAVGVSAGTGFSVDMADFDLFGASAWGITVNNADLKLRDFTIRKTGFAGVFWRILAGGSSRNGPVIENGNINRSDPEDYINSGGILLHSQNPAAMIVSPKIAFTSVSLPQGAFYAAVGIELWLSKGAIVMGNDIHGGRIGYSFGGGRWLAMHGNYAEMCSSYAVEVAGCMDASIMGNTILGPGGRSIGITNTNKAHRTKIVGNTIINCAKPIFISRDSLNVVRA